VVQAAWGGVRGEQRIMDEAMVYFEARYAVHLRVLSARRSVTEVQAQVGAARMAGADFERRYGVSLGDAIRAEVAAGKAASKV
jgi:hypothetical protein